MTLYFWTTILSFIGTLNTIYLSYHAFHKTPVKCLFFPAEWCKKVQFSKYSKILGVPNAYLGLLMYFAIFVLSILGLNNVENTLLPIEILISAGFLFSIYFTVIQTFVLRAFCTWCVISAVEFLILFILMGTIV